jgi:CubicO group peptidase (beta-lactamase class C family)
MTKTRWVLGLLAMLILMSLGPSVRGQGVKPPDAAGQMDKLFEFWNRLDQPGYAALVIKDARVVYEKTFGLACLEHQAPITPKSIFNVATAAELVTGMAAAMLEAQGRWSLDDDVRKYIPELQDFGVPVTIGHLVHHTSGIRDWQAVSRLAGWGQEDITIERVLKAVEAQKRLRFAPGTRTSYSATDYDLLAEAVRRATGKPFQDWTWENIFKPLKMTRTQFRENSRAMIEDQAFSYNYPRTAYFKGQDNLSVMGSHSLMTSLDDLAKWLINLQTGEVGGQGLIQKMLSPAKLTTGERAGYAYGFAVGAYKGFKQLSVIGDWAGYGVAVFYYPDQKVGFAVLANWDYSSVDQFVSSIADIYLEPFLKPETKPAAPAAPAPKPSKEVKLSPAVLGRYVGVYRLNLGTLFVITQAGSQLVLTVPGQGGTYPLTAVSETEFALSFPGLLVTFQKNKEGKVHQLVWRQAGTDTVAPRVELVKPTPSELGEYAGSYANDELGLRCGVSLDGDRIVLTPQERSAVPLSPQEKDRFKGNSTDIPAIVFLRDARNAVTGFFIDDEPVRDLVFKKI